MLTSGVKDALLKHLARVRRLHERDLRAGFGRVQLPDALARKVTNANREWGWQWVFPAAKICTYPDLAHRSATISTRRCRSVRFATLAAVPASQNRWGRTRCATALRRLCWRAGTILGPCRSYSGTAISPTRTSRVAKRIEG